MPIVFSMVDFPPFGFVLKPVWSIHMLLNMIMVDSCLGEWVGEWVGGKGIHTVMDSDRR